MKTIIIGSGVAGLTLGAYLAAKGSRVTVLEQAEEIGGALRHAKKDGYEFSRSYLLQRYLPGQFFAGFLGNYGKELEAVRMSRRYVFPEFNLEKPEGVQSPWLQDTLIRRYPNQARGIKGLFAFCDRMRTIAAAQEKIEATNSTALKRSVIWNFLWVGRYVDMQTDRLLHTFIKDEELYRVLTSVLLDKGVSPEEFAGIGLPLLLSEALLDGTMSLKRKDDLMETGACQIQGGTEKLIAALREIIEENGGEILTGKKVKKIRITDSVVKGLFLEDGSYRTSDEGEALAVVMTGGAREMLTRLVGKEYLKADTLEDMEGMRLRPAAFAVHLGLKKSCEIPKGVTQICVKSAKEVAEDMENGIFDPETQGYLFYSSSAFGVPAPADRQTLTLLAFAPAKARGTDYESEKEAIADRLITLADQQIPGLRDAIETVLIETPQTYADLSLLDAPCVGGLAPVNGVASLPHKLEVRGLYLAGQFSGGGGSVGTVMRGAIQTAKMVESDFFLDVAQEVEQEEEDDDDDFDDL